MTGNPDGLRTGLRTLGRLSDLPTRRIKYMPNADEMILRSVDRGILFLMAFWSGASQLAFKKLTKAVARLDVGRQLDLVVVDVDGSPKLYDVPEFQGRVGGYGETLWLRNGRSVAVSIHPDTVDIEANTMALLTME